MLKVNEGLMPFNLYDIQELLSELKAGSYWAAFRRAVAMMNGLVNPTLKAVPFHSNPEDLAKAFSCCDELERWADDAEDVKTGADEAPDFGVIEVIGIIRLVIGVIQMWRNRKKPEAVKPVAAKPTPAAKPVATPAAKPAK